MNQKLTILRQEEHTRPLNVLGIGVTVLASRSETGGGEVTLQRGEEGVGPPQHTHGWDESFYVLSGSVVFHHEGGSTVCPTGAFIHVPANTVHGFQFGPGGGSMLEFTSHTSHSVEMFTDMDTSFADHPAEIPEVIKVLAKHGVELAG